VKQESGEIHGELNDAAIKTPCSFHLGGPAPDPTYRLVCLELHRAPGDSLHKQCILVSTFFLSGRSVTLCEIPLTAYLDPHMKSLHRSIGVLSMPTPVRFLIVCLVAIGIGMLTWGVGGLLKWDAPLIHWGEVVYMDAQGAIGIGVGALAGAATAVFLFRDRAAANSKKGWRGSSDLS